MKPLIVTAIIVAVFLIVWLGFQVQPAPFPNHPQRTPELRTVPLPEGLPAPVERYYRAVYGGRVPVIESAVIKGRARIAPFGLMLPARFVFVHNAGYDYRHYIEATWFGLPLMKVNERYLDGVSLFDIPIAGALEDDPSTNQAGNLAVWAEAAWFPAIWATDPRVRFEPVDEHTALMFVPFEDQQENFVLRFNPATGLLDTMEAMRYRESGDQARKILWIAAHEPGPPLEGLPISAVGSAAWLDQGQPWAVFTLEDVVYNVDVSQYIRQPGP